MEISDCITYACDTPRYKRKDTPGAWIKVSEIKGEMFSSYPVFEFIPGEKGDEVPIQFGNFIIDIDTQNIACEDAIKILDWFTEIYGIEPDQWRIFLSGKKGVHLDLSADICGTTAGDPLLTTGYKRLAKDIEGDLGVNIDTSMYNRGTGKPWRRPNVIRDETGTCKRQIEYNDLFEISDNDDYVTACSSPGDLWEPESQNKNNALADKLTDFIKDAHVAEHEITAILTDSQCNVLKKKMPPCIGFLRGNTAMPTGGANFNDVAIQITAYCVSAGINEASFMNGAKKFIMGYPSTSLTTPEKRAENCRARYRTMSANGYSHSCGAVKTLGFSKMDFDCDFCQYKFISGENSDELSIANPEDIRTRNDSLKIPDEISSAGGLIDMGLEALSAPGMTKIQQFNLPVVLSAIANTIAGKIHCDGVHPNVFNIKVGGSSLGKSESDKNFFTALSDPANNLEHLRSNFNYLTDFASGAALYSALQHSPQTLLVLDEATKIFRRFDSRPDPASAEKMDALLDIYSKSGASIRKHYANQKNMIEVDNPAMSILGNATPIIFDEIKPSDFETGAMQRFDFWMFSGKVAYRDPRRGGANTKMNDFLTGLDEIAAQSTGSELLDALGAPVNIGGTKEFYDDLEIISHAVIDQINATDSDGIKGMIGRKYDLSVKYALLHAAATRPPDQLFNPLDPDNLKWGLSVADMLINWKIDILLSKVTSGTFDADCQYFLSAIGKEMAADRRPTFKTMAGRNRKLKNWSKRLSAEIIEMLITRKEIVVDESKRTTAYFLVVPEK